MPTLLRLTYDNGQPIGPIFPIGAFSYNLIRHEVGTLEVMVGTEWKKSLDFENRIEVYRTIPPLGEIPIRSYFIETIEETTDSQNRGTLRVTGLDANALLDWRDIEAKAGSAQADKTDHADDVMRAYVRDQLAGSIDRLDAAHFSVEADTHSGPSLAKVSHPWDNLLVCLKSVSEEAEAAGTPVYFQVADGDSPATYEFQAKVGQLGLDRSEAGGSPLWVGLAYGNVSAVKFTRDASVEVNHALAAGSDSGAARPLGESIGSRATWNLWSRKKSVSNESNLTDQASLDQAASRAVKQGKVLQRFEISLMEGPGFIFGYNWHFGDRLAFEHDKWVYSGLVNGVRVSVSENGLEAIDAKLEVEV